MANLNAKTSATMLSDEKVNKYDRNREMDMGNLDVKASATVLTDGKGKNDCNQEIDPCISLLNVDWISESKFDVKFTFETLFNGDVLIPDKLPNLPANVRLKYRNKGFVHSFVGLCIWRYMNDGDTWLKPNDLILKKKPANVNAFNHHVKVMKENYHNEYWKHMAALKIQDINPGTLYSFCHNSRNLILQGSWDDNSNVIKGMYAPFKIMLDSIGFKMNNAGGLKKNQN